MCLQQITLKVKYNYFSLNHLQENNTMTHLWVNKIHLICTRGPHSPYLVISIVWKNLTGAFLWKERVYQSPWLMHTYVCMPRWDTRLGHFLGKVFLAEDRVPLRSWIFSVFLWISQHWWHPPTSTRLPGFCLSWLWNNIKSGQLIRWIWGPYCRVLFCLKCSERAVSLADPSAFAPSAECNYYLRIIGPGKIYL